MHPELREMVGMKCVEAMLVGSRPAGGRLVYLTSDVDVSTQCLSGDAPLFALRTGSTQFGDAEDSCNYKRLTTCH